MKNKKNGQIIIPAKRRPWAHELRVANTLALNGYKVEFLPENNAKTPDILLNGIPYVFLLTRLDNKSKSIN